jgi:hypothetical protein
MSDGEFLGYFSARIGHDEAQQQAGYTSAQSNF